MAWTKAARRAAYVGMAGCLLAATGSLGAAGAAELSAASRPAGSHQTLRLYVLQGKTKVVTSRHAHRTLTLRVQYEPQGASFAARAAAHPSADLEITLATKGESNLWDFSLPGSAFAASPSKGTGRMRTGSRIAPYGVVHLTIKPAGKLHTHTICAEEHQTSRTVQVTGHLLFNTGPHAAHSLGKVGSSRHAFSLRAQITATYDKPTDDPSCDVPEDQPCPTAVTAESFTPQQPDGTSTSFIASPRGTHEALEGSRDTELSKPSGAQRVDEVQTTAETPTITPQQQGTSVTVTANGARAAGSATFDAPGAPTTSTPDYCKHPSSETFYNATLATDPTLHFHNTLGGTFAVPNVLSSGVYFTYQFK